MSKIIKGWKHTSGVHCGSVAIRDVCNYYGYKFSEEICLGLGAGLGFYYTVDKEMSPTRAIHLRGPLMETNFFKNFGFELDDWKYEADSEKAFELLKYYIDRDIPVLIQTDIYYLDYYNSNTHFPGHIVVVCGYSDEQEIFYLSDTSFEHLQTVSYKDMIESRISKYKPNPLSNNWFEVDLSDRVIDLEDAVSKSIRLNAEMMVEGVTTTRGFSGVDVIKQWADDLPRWKDIEDLKWSSRFSYQVISKRGVDGAGFRWMYRDFLKEVSRFNYKIDSLSLAEKMDIIGKKWYEVSALLKQTSESFDHESNLTETSSLVKDLYTLENEYYSTVLENF